MSERDFKLQVRDDGAHLQERKYIRAIVDHYSAEILNYVMAFLLVDVAIFSRGISTDLQQADQIRLALLASGNVAAGLASRALRRHAIRRPRGEPDCKF